MTAPYYTDGQVTLYHGDCREVTEWLAGDVLLTDPPYGRAWHAGSGMTNAAGQGRGSKPHAGIAGDKDTTTRDAALAAWGDRLGIVFGDLLIAPPAGTVQALIYGKPMDAGIKGARAGFRRDAEAIYLVGRWPVGVGGRTSILRTGALVAGPRGLATRTGHPHAKPLDVLDELIAICPPGVIVDPFAGGGSTLIAARNTGRKAVGVEIDEQHCERAARRLDQGALVFGEALA
jgi:hypothetical protein